MKKIESILIANRSEIARRVIRTASELDISTTAVYSPHDRSALFAREADHAVALAGNAPRESYLDQDQIIAAAKKSKATRERSRDGLTNRIALFFSGVSLYHMLALARGCASGI